MFLFLSSLVIQLFSPAGKSIWSCPNLCQGCVHCLYKTKIFECFSTDTFVIFPNNKFLANKHLLKVSNRNL